MPFAGNCLRGTYLTFENVNLVIFMKSCPRSGASCGGHVKYFQTKQIKNLDTHLKILPYVSYMQSYKNKPSETLGTDSIRRLEISDHCLSQSFTCCTLHKSSIIEIKSIFIQLQNKPFPKAIEQELLVVNNGV